MEHVTPQVHQLHLTKTENFALVNKQLMCLSCSNLHASQTEEGRPEKQEEP